MGELETRKFAGIDLRRSSVQFSVYDEAKAETSEESFQLNEEEQKDYIISMKERSCKPVYEYSGEDGPVLYTKALKSAPAPEEELASVSQFSSRRPSFMTMTRSNTGAASSRMWVEITNVRPVPV